MKKPRNEIEKIVAKWSKEYQKLTLPLIEVIQERIKDGEPVDLVIKETLKKLPVQLQKLMVDAVVSGASMGAGVAATSALSGKLLSLSWSPDGFTLSQRLHQLDRESKAMIIYTISDSIRKGTSVVALARKLFDGYGNGSDYTGTAELPEYLSALVSATRKLQRYSSPEEMRNYLAQIRKTKRAMESMKNNTALKAAYRELLQGAEELNQKAMERAVRLAIAEKSRYLAERIARTETARAWSDGFYARYLQDDEVMGFRWSLSTAHERIDICDFYARADLFGLGPGIYPTNQMPPHPAHPHCTCLLEPVFGRREEQNPLLDSKSADSYFQSLSSGNRELLLGKEGAERWQKGGDWQKLLRNWSGWEDPKTRLDRTDFE